MSDMIVRLYDLPELSFFYRKTVDAVFIPKSDVGIYKDLLVLSTDGK